MLKRLRDLDDQVLTQTERFRWYFVCILILYNKTSFMEKFPYEKLMFIMVGHLVQMSRDMTKPTMWLCAQRRLRSAWASAQSDQSLPCPHE